MVMLECAGPFQWKPSYVAFGNFRRAMWGWFAVTHYTGGINELLCGIAAAGVSIYKAEMRAAISNVESA